MAATHISSGTTVGAAVTTVTFANWYHNIEIVNRSSGDMWARVDGVDPTVGGDDCFFIAAMSSIDVINGKLPPEPAIGQTSNTVVKIITAANQTYSVQAGV
jgi:hypothetical protein